MNDLNNNPFIIGALLSLGLFSLVPGLAHLCVQAQFDIHKTFTVSGTVAKVEWIHPHSYLTTNKTGAHGKAQKRAFELGGTGAIRRAGMSPEDRGGLKPGGEVTASCLAAKDGSTAGFLPEMKVADGRLFKFAMDPNGNSE
jgi:Family of unknown function (DUF6152)